jgi:D-alanyl-D-alanine carboxypeptidase/D-alanyl-D-alanine-endopeptidase (penicillin-binding protein 4)
LDAIFRPDENWSVAIGDPQSKTILYEHRSKQPRMPASNMKVYVTAAAFDLLGPDFRYRTPLMGRGHLDANGVWQGDLLVRGSGDPTFSGRFEEDEKEVTGRLDRWAERLKKYGVRAIEGNILGDASIFDDDYWGQGWPENSWCDWYTAASGGLILNDGCIDVAVYPSSKVGGAPVVKTLPDTEYIQIQNQAKTTGGKDKTVISFQRSFEKNDLKLLGRVPAGSRGSQHAIAVTDPTGYFINVFKEVLQRHGIEVRGMAIDASKFPDLPTSGWKVLAWSESPELSKIIKEVNTKSQNLFADTLLKTLGAHKAGMGNWAGGNRVVGDWARTLGLDSEVLHLQDGSGLSRLNRVTAYDTLGLLVQVTRKPWFQQFHDSLAVSGTYPGSLRNRMGTSLLKGKVHAKTGYIDDVYALSGYVETAKGNIYAYSMIFNGKTHAGRHPKSRMDDALTLLAKEL